MHGDGRKLDWDDLRVVLAIVRHGSLTAASRALGVTQPTAGRRLDQVERRLGMALFERTGAGLVLNRLGTALLEPAEQMERAALAVERRIAAHGTGIDGLVRITTLEWVGHHVLAPLLAGFCRLHSGLSVELLTADRAFSLARHETDLAVWATPFEQEGLVRRRLGGSPRALYASADYLARHGTPDYDEGCPGHTVITFPENLFVMPDLQWLRERLAPRAHVALQSNSIDVQAAAAAAGAGLAVLPRRVGDALPDLRRLEPPEPPPQREFWLGYHEDLRNTPRVRALADYVAAEIGR